MTSRKLIAVLICGTAFGMFFNFSRVTHASQGTSAIANATPNVSGAWMFRGIQGQACYITEVAGGTLQLVTEKGVHMNGHFQDPQTIVIDDSEFAGMTGQVSSDARTITWSNGERWLR